MIVHHDDISDSLLSNHGLRKTVFRKDVLSFLLKNKGRAISSSDIENYLGEFDRITLYRTLKTFEEKGLIHQAFDQAGQTKYALCNHECVQHAHHDSHAHFHCNECGETLCLDEFEGVFDNLVPSGYNVKDIQITFSGTCKVCN